MKIDEQVIIEYVFGFLLVLLLYVKCRIAAAPKSGEVRKNVMLLCADLLETVKKKFNQVEAICRVKDCIYLQVISTEIIWFECVKKLQSCCTLIYDLC